MIIYELWDTRSRNLIGTYTSEADALATVREVLALHGPLFGNDLILGWADDEQGAQGGEIANGEALILRAESHQVV